MDNIKELISQFKIPIIAVGGLLLMFILSNTVVPMIQDKIANKTPIVEIEAKNTKVYKNTDELVEGDFKVTAIHEDGAKTSISSDQIELSKTSLDPVGNSTTVTLTYKEKPSIACNVDVEIEREKVMGFECGYPNENDVIAVLYSNGELCFEGSGDTLIAEQGKYLWSKYVDQIKAVTFEKDVTPRVMDYWFDKMEELTYVGAIPSSVQSMKGTFNKCISLTTMADWTNCDSLLDISSCYAGCTNLKYTVEVPGGVVKADSAFEGCILIPKTPNLSNAVSMRQAIGMFKGCSKLVSITMPPNLIEMDSMFEDCMNLQIMPTIPASVTSMTKSFSKCVALKQLTVIPANVDKMENCFAECEFIDGTVTINANPTKMNNCFKGACVATRLDLNGSSIILDAFANSNEYGNITVNGHQPIPEIKSLDTYNKYIENLEREKLKEQQRAQQNGN